MRQRLAGDPSRESPAMLVFLGSSRVQAAIHEGRMSRRLSGHLSRPVTAVAPLGGALVAGVDQAKDVRAWSRAERSDRGVAAPSAGATTVAFARGAGLLIAPCRDSSRTPGRPGMYRG